MGVTRRIIFPALRLVIWAVIAVCLVKLAFVGSQVTPAGETLTPTGQVRDPVVAASTGTVTNAVTVAGSVVADPAVPVKATLAGTVSKLLAADGQAVDVGTPILEIRLETPRDPLVTTDPLTGIQTSTERKPTVTIATVTAPVAGTLTLPTLKDQIVSVGNEVARVVPGTLSVTGTLTADQQYRLVGAPAEATVTLKGGPAPFTCSGLRIGAAPVTGTGADGSNGTPTSGAVACAIPHEVTAFPGLGADIAIVNGTATDAVVVPVTAVQGAVQKGNVWVVSGEGAAPTERAVTLGLTDGELVQIVDGLTIGEQVLQFVPASEGSTGAPDCSNPRTYDPRVCAG